MSTPGPAIFLGDLVRALRSLEVSDSSLQTLVAGMLGLQLVQPEVKKEGSEQAQIAPQTPTTKDEPPDELPVPAPSSTRNSFRVTVDFIPSESSEWIPGVKPLRQRKAINKANAAASRLTPLLLPRWTRAILRASLATSGTDGPFDIEKIAETLSRGESLQELPRLSAPTLRHGVQLLMDQSRAMLPFMRDQVWMQDEILKVVGLDKVKIEYFVGSPQRGAGSGLKPWPSYEPPSTGTPVVLLTDLGICQPMLSNEWADAGEWLEFARVVRRAQCPLLAFVPYGPARWPRQLTKMMTIIQWDRNTTAATVSGLLGHAREASRS